MDHMTDSDRQEIAAEADEIMRGYTRIHREINEAHGGVIPAAAVLAAEINAEVVRAAALESGMTQDDLADLVERAVRAAAVILRSKREAHEGGTCTDLFGAVAGKGVA